ncbi:hypothetical protein Y032_0060g3093 [Ancylostoma ceylanicum]|uniref:Uncharacterized protein n=1 Tax=Ancylostoma ceylanicum TaxID=53326 RepID=A0A016U3E9_9BILA|nr:hypothetical protein Y032_0060g3093 [Ancylostoma ceylanicum]
MEEGRGDHVTKETEGYYSPAINTSLIEMRGSPTDTVAISLDETKPKRGRRGQPTVAEVSLVEGTTPPRNAQKKNNLDTPPSRKTPGAVRTSKVTPNQPPTRTRK